MSIKLIVNDHPLKGKCSLEDHFMQSIDLFMPYKDKHGNTRDLHPLLKNITTVYPTSPQDDSIHLEIDGTVVKIWEGDGTLDLGKIMSEIIVEISKHQNNE